LLVLIDGIVHHTLHTFALCVSVAVHHHNTVGVFDEAVMSGHVPLGVHVHPAAPLYTVDGVHELDELLHPFQFTFHVIVI
jgi:hypothetical protein